MYTFTKSSFYTVIFRQGSRKVDKTKVHKRINMELIRYDLETVMAGCLPEITISKCNP